MAPAAANAPKNSAGHAGRESSAGSGGAGEEEALRLIKALSVKWAK